MCFRFCFIISIKIKVKINNTKIFHFTNYFRFYFLSNVFLILFYNIVSNWLQIGNPEMSRNLRNEWQFKTLKLLLLDLDQKNNKV